MKSNQEKKALTFGEFILATYDALGDKRARGLVWLSVNAHLVEFRGHKRFSISR